MSLQWWRNASQVASVPYYHWTLADGPTFADTGSNGTHPSLVGTTHTAYGQSGLFAAQVAAQVQGSGSDSISGSFSFPTSMGASLFFACNIADLGGAVSLGYLNTSGGGFDIYSNLGTASMSSPFGSNVTSLYPITGFKTVVGVIITPVSGGSCSASLMWSGLGTPVGTMACTGVPANYTGVFLGQQTGLYGECFVFQGYLTPAEWQIKAASIASKF